MRKFIVKILAVLTAVSCVFALALPERAYAYESYSRNEVSSAWGAGYAFLASLYPEIPYDSDFDNGNYGGFPGAADFVATVVTAPSSPFMLWVHNYVYYWFSEWRVQTYDDLPDDSEAQQRLIDQQLDAADFIIREWEIWKEKYPGAGGGSGGGSGGGTDVPDSKVTWIITDTISNSMTFPNGKPCTFSDASVAYYNAHSSQGPIYAVAMDTADISVVNFNGCIAFSSSRSFGPCSNFLGFSITTPYYNPFQESTVDFCSALFSSNASYYDTTRNGDFYSFTRTPSVSPAYLPSPYRVSVVNGATNLAPTAKIYLVTNSPVYVYDTEQPDGSTPPVPEGPTGPTAPDIPSPETPVINNPVSPTIPLTFTDTGNTYTGNETDYSQYLQIIIDNQNTQIDQLKDLSNGIVQIWDNYMGWLDSEFDAFYQWFQHFDANWNTLFEWLHTIAEDLFSIDQTFTAFRNEVLDVLERIVNVLYRIFDKIGMRYSPDSPNPSLEPDSGLDISDPLMTWIKGVIDNILAAISAGIAGLIGTATSSVGNLSNLFPFSLLFDLSLMLGLLNHEPVAPVFDIPYPFSANQNAVLIHVDLSPWTPVMQSLRPMWVLLFALGLAYLSIDMIMALYNFLSPGGDN